jgi:hypothetical protein
MNIKTRFNVPSHDALCMSDATTRPPFEEISFWKQITNPHNADSLLTEALLKSIINSNARSSPLVKKTVGKSELKKIMNIGKNTAAISTFDLQTPSNSDINKATLEQ